MTEHLTGQNIRPGRDLAITIGKFDGLHRGHMHLIAKLKQIAAARGLGAALLSFDPHPAAFLTGAALPLLLSRPEKLYLLEQTGIDFYIELGFDKELAQTSPREFLVKIVHEQLRGRALVVGEDFAFGEGGAGRAATARAVGGEIGLDVNVIPNIAEKGKKISSEGLRRLVDAADFAAFKDMAGRRYFLMGKADCRGAFKPGEGKLLPPAGIYATRTFYDGTVTKSITKVDALVENIAVGDADLGGKSLRVEFCDVVSMSYLTR